MGSCAKGLRVILACAIATALFCAVAASAWSCKSPLHDQASLDAAANNTEAPGAQAVESSGSPSSDGGAAAEFIPSSSALPSVQDSLEAYSWDDLSAISNAISSCASLDEAFDLAREFRIIDETGSPKDHDGKTIVLADGTTATVVVAGIWSDQLETDEKAGITFCFEQCISVRPMNSSNDNTGGWEQSAMRRWMNSELLLETPSDLACHIAPVRKATPDVNETENLSSSTTTIDRLWLPSFDELTYQPAQYQLYAGAGIAATGPNDALVKKSGGSDGTNGTPCSWWCRTPAMTHVDGFYHISPDGHIVRVGPADIARGVAPFFCLD